MSKRIGIVNSNELAISKEQIEQLTQPLIIANKKETRLIKSWDELKEVESDTHTLEIDEYSGWIHPKVPDESSWVKNNHYLSTHTFYGLNYTYSTRILQECGFNVQLENWDGETEWFDMDEYLESEKIEQERKVKSVIKSEEFKEQRLYDLLNKMANVRYTMPVFHKCKSCGFEVVS